MTPLQVDIKRKAFDTPTLEGIAFTIQPDERVALIGPSGSGKSTMLSIIAGLDAAFDGTISRPVGAVAMVFQNPRLLPWRTLAQNISIVISSGGEDRARSLLAQVGLDHAADLFPEKASLGMQRRAALARALAVEPALILLDEPLVSLDPETAASLRDLLRSTFDRTGSAVLFATHDRREAIELADRVIELEGTPATLCHDRQSPLSRSDRQNPSKVEALFSDWYGTAPHPYADKSGT